MPNSSEQGRSGEFGQSMSIEFFVSRKARLENEMEQLRKAMAVAQKSGQMTREYATQLSIALVDRAMELAKVEKCILEQTQQLQQLSRARQSSFDGKNPFPLVNNSERIAQIVRAALADENRTDIVVYGTCLWSCSRFIPSGFVAVFAEFQDRISLVCFIPYVEYNNGILQNIALEAEGDGSIDIEFVFSETDYRQGMLVPPHSSPSLN